MSTLAAPMCLPQLGQLHCEEGVWLVGHDKFLWQRHAARKAPSPKGGSGREWCYVEAQVAVMELEFSSDAVACKLAVPGSWSLPG